MESADEKVRQRDVRIAELERENEVLSGQVKRLIRAEGRLYAYQEELDAQLREYKELYRLNRELSALPDLEKLCRLAVDYAVRILNFERALFLRLDEGARVYRVSAMEGYYEDAERASAAELTIGEDAPFLKPLMEGEEYLLCLTDTATGVLTDYCVSLGMDEYFVYPLGGLLPPHALLVLGNTNGNAEFYRRVNPRNGTLLSVGNVVGIISSSIENYLFYRKMEEALERQRRAEEKYHGIFENAVEGMFQRTPGGRYLDVNPAFARMLGYSSPEELLANVTDAGRQIYVDPKRYEEITRILEERGVAEGAEAQIYRRDGSVNWLSISARAVRDDTGKVLYYEGIAEDVTARKVAEEALRESERKYRQLSEALEERVKEAVNELRQKDRILILQGRQAVMGEMISNIAHQWRQPLNVLGLLAQELQLMQELGRLTKEHVAENVKKTMEVILQMSKTIDDFRNFFKPDKEMVQFPVAEAIGSALSVLDGSFTAAGIRLDLQMADDPLISGFPGEFTQVVLNILVNARDALTARKVMNPTITIRLVLEGARPVVTITDNAGGIPTEILDRIFDPYFTTKGPEQGTGIGLYMCKTIIEKSMGGALHVRNVGDGAEFRIEV